MIEIINFCGRFHNAVLIETTSTIAVFLANGLRKRFYGFAIIPVSVSPPRVALRVRGLEVWQHNECGWEKNYKTPSLVSLW